MAQRNEKHNVAPDTSNQEFVISRVFDAPRDLVFRAFTEPERMKKWWGPKGFTVIAAKMDLRPGGTYHYGLRAPDGNTMWGKLSTARSFAPSASFSSIPSPMKRAASPAIR